MSLTSAIKMQNVCRPRDQTTDAIGHNRFDDFWEKWFVHIFSTKWEQKLQRWKLPGRVFGEMHPPCDKR